MTEEQRVLAQISQCDSNIEWLTETMEVTRQIGDALRSGTLERRVSALANAERVLREQRP